MDDEADRARGEECPKRPPRFRAHEGRRDCGDIVNDPAAIDRLGVMTEDQVFDEQTGPLFQEDPR